MNRFLPLVFLFGILWACSSSDDATTNDTGPGTDTDSGTTSSDPVISSINFSLDNSFAGDQIDISAIVSDPDNDIVDYEWTISDGSFEVVSDTSIIWSSPDTPVNATVTLTVTDSESNSATRSEDLFLELRPTTYQRSIGGEYYRLSSNTLLQRVDEYIYMYVSQPIGSGGSELKLLKLDYFGEEIWSKTIAIRPSDPAGVYYFERTADDNFLVNNSTGVAKVDFDGNILWTLDVSVGEFIQLANGNYFFTTYISGADVTGYYIISPEGSVLALEAFSSELESLRTYDVTEGPESDTYFILSRISAPRPEPNMRIVQINSDGGYLGEINPPNRINFGEAGTINKNADGTYTLIYNSETDSGFTNTITYLNINADGTVNAEEVYTNDDHMQVYNALALEDGGYLIYGTIGSSERRARSLFLRIDADGNEQWRKDYGNDSDLMDFACSAVELPSGGLIISGSEYIIDPATGNFVQVYLHSYNSDGSL